MRPISNEASRGYSHLTSGTSKGSFTPLLQLKRFPTYPSPLERKHENPAHIQRNPVSASLLERRDPFLRGRGRIPGIPVASQEEALSTGKARGTPGSCHHYQSPQMSQSIPGNPVFPALPRLSSRGSTHTTVARGTALWESLMGKHRGKAWGKAVDPFIHVKGSVTLLLQLGRKAHVHAPT